MKFDELLEYKPNRKEKNDIEKNVKIKCFMEKGEVKFTLAS